MSLLCLIIVTIAGDRRRETAGVKIRQMGVVRADEIIYVDEDIIINNIYNKDYDDSQSC